MQKFAFNQNRKFDINIFKEMFEIRAFKIC